ncbi:hypothetical protein Tco_1411850 [Tanacetum coccineum]
MRNAIGAHYLPHSSEYVAPPSIDFVRPWYETIGYGETILAKGALKKSLLPPRWSLVNGINIDYASIFWEDIIIKLNKQHKENIIPYTRLLSLLMMHKMKEGYRDGELTIYPIQVFSVNNWALKPNQPEEPPFTYHILAICAADKPVVFKAPKPSSNAERVSQGTKSEAKPGHKKHSSLKPSSVSSKEATKDIGMHKEDQQETGGPTSLGVTRNGASVVFTAEANPGNSAPSDFIPQHQDLDSLEDDLVIVVDDSDEDEEDEVHATENVKIEDTLVPTSSSPRSSQIQELTNQVLIL